MHIVPTATVRSRTDQPLAVLGLVTALLTIALLAGTVSAAPVLQVDVNDAAGTTNTQPGFTSLLEADVEAGAGDTYSKTINGILVNIDGIPNGNDRLRTTPINNPPALTQAALYQDFGFTPGSATIDFSGLDALSEYAVTVWSFDTGSGGDRTSEWSVTTGTGDPALITYTFNGSNPPLEDFDNTFQFSAITDAAGQLQLTGNSIAGGNAVFINAFQLEQVIVPEPASVAIWTLLGAIGLFWAWRRRRTTA